MVDPPQQRVGAAEDAILESEELPLASTVNSEQPAERPQETSRYTSAAGIIIPKTQGFFGT